MLLLRFGYTALAAALTLAACVEGGELVPDEPATPTAPEEVVLTTEDGKNIAGTWHPARGVERGGVGDHTAAHGGDKTRLIGFCVASALRGEVGSFTQGDGQCKLDRA